MAMFFRLWVSHGLRFKSWKDTIDAFPGTVASTSATVTGVGTVAGAWAGVALGFTLDGTFTDKETTFALDVESLDSLRRLREALLSSESDSDPDSSPSSDPEPARLDWLTTACSESLSWSETDNIPGARDSK